MFYKKNCITYTNDKINVSNYTQPLHIKISF